MDALTARKVKNFKQFEKNNIELYSKNNTKGEIGIQRQMVGRASRITPWSFNLQFLPHAQDQTSPQPTAHLRAAQFISKGRKSCK